MSYQNPDLVLPQSVKSINSKNGTWKYISVGLMASLGAIGLLAVSFNTKTFQSSSMSKLQLAKSGAMTYSSLSDNEMEDLFDEFIDTFGREYDSSDEKEEKFTNFKSFLELVDSRNSAEKSEGGSATHGITIFADISQEEFQSAYLGYKATTNGSKKSKKSKKAIAPRKKSTTATAVNWAGVYTTDVKDQGYCGSCWAFSVTEQIESDSIRAGILSTDDALSPQQIVSCDTTNYGCSGGNTETAYDYVTDAGGIEMNSVYPYTSYYDETGTCKSKSSKYVVTVTDYYALDGETAMEDYVLTTGPLSVCLDASTWSSYTSGIVSNCGKDVDHCVQAVGVDMDNGYWIVRNSWGTSWGESGYIYLKTGQNTCYITYDPTYTSVEEV